jgi:hypothetical protein
MGGTMKSQWECLLENLGEWQGSFTQLSAQGQPKADIPTVVTLHAIHDNKTVQQQIVRQTVPPQETQLEYSTLGRGVLFFEDGAFSQGSIQRAPFSEFGAEFGFIAGDRRLRLVQLFNTSSQLDQFTLIREHRAGTPVASRPPLQIEDLLGVWQGQAVTQYPDWRNPTQMPTRLEIQRQGDRLLQSLTLGSNDSPMATITSEGVIEAGDRILFRQGNQPVQVLLLPDGASATAPLQTQPGVGFFLEASWLMHPHLRQRMIRTYSDKGEWVGLTLVSEQKKC